MGKSKSRDSVIVRIAGAAGDGIASVGEIFGKICSRLGLHVIAYNSFQSAIRGGHVWLQLNIGSQKNLSHGEEPDVVILLNKTSPLVHIPQVKKGGVVLYNSSTITEDLSQLRKDVTYYGMNFKELIHEDHISPVMGNTMLLGALVHLLGLDAQHGLDFIEERFAKKGEEVVELNKKVLSIGAEWAEGAIPKLDVQLKGDGKKRVFLTGNHALGMGLLAGGLKFYAGYPMSPATGIMHYLATKTKSHKIILKQTEDEIAAVNYIIGAAHAGVRVATATSGGGFALMTEGLGLAGMMEEPIVVINVQRGGPSTGIPTKQEQGDLNLLLGASQGEFPRIIMAPKDPEDAFYTAWRALNLAEKYQTPVLILSDTFLSESFQTADDFNFDQPIDRGKLERSLKDGDSYKRFLITKDGVSPRLVPGVPKGMYCSVSDEHDEEGVVITDVLAGLPTSLKIRNEMHAKRMKKLELARQQDINPPTLTGDKKAEFTLLGWGSTYDAIEEACQILGKNGIKANHLHFTDLFPLPNEKVLKVLQSCKEVISVENNYTSQMCRLIRAETGFEIKRHVSRYDGEPFTGEDICQRVKKELGHA